MRIFPFYNAYHGRNHKEHAIQLAELVLKTTPSLSYVAPHCKGTPKKREKIRIGFLSEFMHKITVNQFFKDIVEGLAQDKDLEIYVFSNSPIVNPTVQEVAGKVHKYVRISGELQDLRAPIAREEIDILIFLEIGIAQMFYFLAFSRLAPIQIVCGGHPITTGIPTMDYFLSTKGCHGDNPQAEYTEKPLLLERIIAVFHRPPAIEKIRSRKELGLPEEGNLYSCPVTLFKLHPDMDKIFSRILERDPKARIILFDPILPLWRSQLEARFIRTIPPAFHNRIHFIPFAKKEVFLEMMHCMDAVLDPLHFSFGTTAYLMLGINLPFATWPGEFMRGRTADYMFKQMGIPELIGSTHEEYADIAIRLATDKQFRADMIEKIRAKSDILFNDRTAIDEFAVCLKQLYAKQ